MDWYWSIDDQSITTQKPFIDYYRLTWQPQTDISHATCPIIRHFQEDLGKKLVYNSDPVISMQRIYPVAQVLKSPTCPSLPLHVIMSTQEVREEALLNIRCIVRGYHLCRFEVNAGEVFTANKKRGERGNAFKVVNHRGQLGHLQSELVDPLWPVLANISVSILQPIDTNLSIDCY